jgi:hypothetical protein
MMKIYILTFLMFLNFAIIAQKVESPIHLWVEVGESINKSYRIQSFHTINAELITQVSKKWFVSYKYCELGKISELGEFDFNGVDQRSENKFMQYYFHNVMLGYQLFNKNRFQFIAQVGGFQSYHYYNGKYIGKTNSSSGMGISLISPRDIYEVYNFKQNGLAINFKSIYSGGFAGVTTNIFTHLAKQPLAGIGIGINIGYVGK